MTMDVNKLILSNVSVEFPFRPYPCQVVYMEKVIQALQQASAARLLKIVEIYYRPHACTWHVHVLVTLLLLRFFDHFCIKDE